MTNKTQSHPFVFRFLLIAFALSLVFFSNSCKPPRSPIIDSQVRMLHRYDGELGIPARTDEQPTPDEFSTDATRVEQKPKGIKKLFSIFKKKNKEGPDENDLKVVYNPNAARANKVDSLKPNVDQLTYEQKIRPGAGPEVTLDGKDPEQIYKGVPWWYPNKNAKVGQGYKPGYRYPGYRDLTMEKRLSYYKKSMKVAKKNQAKRRKQYVKDSTVYMKNEDRKKVEQQSEEEYQKEVQRRKEIDPFGELGEVKRKKKGLLNNIFQKKPKKEKDNETPTEPKDQPAEKPKEKTDEF